MLLNIKGRIKKYDSEYAHLSFYDDRFGWDGCKYLTSKHFPDEVWAKIQAGKIFIAEQTVLFGFREEQC